MDREHHGHTMWHGPLLRKQACGRIFLTRSMSDFSHLPTTMFKTPSRSRRRVSTAVKFLLFLTALFSLLLLSVTNDGSVTSFVDHGRTALSKDWSIWRDMSRVAQGDEVWLENMDDLTASHATSGDLEVECEGWVPEGDEAEDPAGCLRARQYRQTQRVLAREEKAEQ